VKHVPVVLAHRGASAAAPENTVEAFRLAAALGADGVELDARRTADGVLVVHHDAMLPDGGAIVAQSAAALRAARPALPTLAEALDACTGIVNVEVKNFPTEPDYDPDERVASGVAALVGERGLRERVVVSSFTTAAIDRVLAVDPAIPTGWLLLPNVDVAGVLGLARERGYRAVHPERRSLASEPARVVDAAHDHGLVVHVWTVDDPDEMRALAAAGVDAIITNVPDVARAALGPPAPRR
jgi:glycerophosphoryl diester phosphodiesterase